MSIQHPKPIYRITLDGKDLTSSIAPRLIRLALTECRGEDADTLDLQLDDSDGALAIPKRGATLDVAFGWEADGLVDKGSFKIDEAEYSGTPDTIAVRARSASLSAGLGKREERSWHGKTIGDIVSTIAKFHKLTPKVAAELAKVAIAHIDQSQESDMSFLTRLAKRYDAVMNVKDSNLLFMPIGAGVTVSGKPLQVLEITRRAGDRHRFHIAEREAYEGVRAYWYDSKTKKRHSVLVGGEDNRNLKVLPEKYPSRAEAEAAAKAEYNRVKRGQATMSLDLALGIPELFPEMPVWLSGWKPEIDETPWLLRRVTHNISNSGFTSLCEFEMRDDPKAERHRTRMRRGGQ
ncbi:phage late control D family protein [Cupriavidus sp. UGS-1]|uniref:phage late control D family protein n=1 Tax=Cupriavidus sp. UGS-1 TaxID=2899826 RepID=UPI001E4BFF55|nr:phage late control D family protein [Cupriavidus sp. UGS-1]MCD9124001.1 phage late control D family protein [Cupriavidus sp. UGS-1]